MAPLRQRLAREEGLTLIELFFVVLVLGILLAITVPSYLGYKARGNQAAASANVHAALPVVEAYRADCGKYADAAASECADGVARTFDVAGLKTYEPGLRLQTVKSVAGGARYCVEAQVGGKTASFTGPGGSIASTACA
jgi:Tfp pilus assembly protein PilE